MKVEKDYIIGQLEKKLADEDFYLRQTFKKKQIALDDGFNLIRELKYVPLEKQEKKTFYKFMNMLKKIQETMK